MALTRVFKFGEGQAVRIPAELAYADTSVDLAISRDGDTITIRPARPTMREMVAALRTMPKPSEVEVHQPIELPERERN